MDEIEEELDSTISDGVNIYDDFAVDKAEDNDGSYPAINETTSFAPALRKSSLEINDDKPEVEEVKTFYSIPEFIVCEKHDGDSSDFFDTSPSVIKDFLLAQVLGIRIFVFVLQLLFNSWDFSTDAFKGVPVEEGIFH
ncbi:unnamed protein product [Strongylus vulgaris]|uniref:Uncharacterized protein n=1 Tax=Strongylus vulgaris TaxID=40348 RepID=A0A3P7J2C5_STRVU|nr:unnamed protein product [Strongylus vulgaris]